MTTSKKAKKQRQIVELRFPSTEAWQNVVRDCKLTPAQADTLKFTLEEALDEINRHQSKLKNQPGRALLVDGIKKFDKALSRLLEECRRSGDLMHFFLPNETLAYVGRSLTFSAMSEALGRNVVPTDFDFDTGTKRTPDKHITVASIEQDSLTRREFLGLQHGHLILTYFVERIRGPLARWIELDRQNKGGRQPDALRRHLIYRLAEEAPDIIGKSATAAVTGKFVDLCTAVLVACGLPETGIAKAIPSVVRKLRADQAKRRRRVR